MITAPFWTKTNVGSILSVSGYLRDETLEWLNGGAEDQEDQSTNLIISAHPLQVQAFSSQIENISLEITDTLQKQNKRMII